MRISSNMLPQRAT